MEALGAAGDGIATFEGGRVFIPGGLPGERVEAREVGSRAGHPVFAIAALLRRSPERAEPPCPHFGACGGCAAQHMADAAYVRWKRALLAGPLARAGFADAPIAPLVRTPPGARRRARFAILRERDGSVRVGFHARGGQAVEAVSVCPVLDPRLAGLIAPLGELCAGLRCLGRQAAAMVNLLDHGPDLLLQGAGTPDAPGRARLVAFARGQGMCRISWATGRASAEPVAELAPPVITLSGQKVAAPPGAFLQASREGEAAIIAAVQAGLPPRLRRLADLHAGLGTLSFALAGRAGVAAFEADEAAYAALGRAAGGTRVRAVRRDLVRQPLRPDELASFDAVVLDPPFAGAAAQIAELAAGRVRHVAYVSCNPATFARDARVLGSAGFALTEVTPIDQFLWSAELECVAHFRR